MSRTCDGRRHTKEQPHLHSRATMNNNQRRRFWWTDRRWIVYSVVQRKLLIITCHLNSTLDETRSTAKTGEQATATRSLFTTTDASALIGVWSSCKRCHAISILILLLSLWLWEKRTPSARWSPACRASTTHHVGLRGKQNDEKYGLTMIKMEKI